MSVRHLVATVSLLMFVSSCVPTKRLKYLQETEATTDSIITVERIQKPYRIQVNDLLSIRVKAIDQDAVGMFNPIGDENPNATGEERLYYDGFLVDAHGNIRVPTLGEVNVLGEIGSGSQVIYKEQVTIMEAIANAGDISEFGDRTDVVIVRQYPGGEKRHHIDLTTIDAMRSPYYYIQPNDLIIVNPLPQKTIGLGTTGLEVFRTVTSVLALVVSSVLIFTR